MLQEKFNNILDDIIKFTHFDYSKKLALAVSGGSDSIALLYLTYNYAIKNDIKLSIFTVDHNLRPESKQEANYVKNLAIKLGCDFYDFCWDHGWNDDDKKSNIQESARSLRYDLMTSKCLDLDIKILLTAHHFDDIIETYLMRKRRGGGVFSCSYSNNFFYNSINIFRPLLDFNKFDLIKFLKTNNIAWIEDSSNQSDDYERNRIRKEIFSYSFEKKSELQKEVIANNKLAVELNNDLLNILSESLKITKYGFALLDLKKISNLSDELVIQIINYSLTVVGGKDQVPRFRGTKKILDKIRSSCKIDSTLHGCVLKSIKDNNLIIYREKRFISDSIELNSNKCWDNRFNCIANAFFSGYYVDSLKESEYLAIKDSLDLENLSRISQNNHKLILFTLPVVKYLEKVVAIPHIYYYDDVKIRDNIFFEFSPSFFSRFTHFI